jgi:hypothetical protein
MHDERPKGVPEPRQDYPSQCPACQQQSAQPKSASTVAGHPLTIRLHMLCVKCAHQWSHDKIDEKPQMP